MPHDQLRDLLPEAEQFVAFAEGTRNDFHEPDNQGIEFVGIVGTSLDNAFGDSIRDGAIEEGFQEVILFLRRERGDEITRYKFNLANIFALAQVGAKHLIATETPA